MIVAGAVVYYYKVKFAKINKAKAAALLRALGRWFSRLVLSKQK